MANLVELIKQAAVEAVNASDPAAFYFGTVTSADPLSINIEQKMDLTSEFLILTNAVKDHEVTMTVDHMTEYAELDANHTHTANNSVNASATEGEVNVSVDTQISQATIDLTHGHKYTGTKMFTVHNALKVGEKVVLIRIQGGQKFVVLDRV